MEETLGTSHMADLPGGLRSYYCSGFSTLYIIISDLLIYEPKYCTTLVNGTGSSRQLLTNVLATSIPPILTQFIFLFIYNVFEVLQPSLIFALLAFV